VVKLPGETAWSVRLLVERDAAWAVSRPEAWVVPRAFRRVVAGGFLEDDVEADTFITVELVASGSDEAERIVIAAIRVLLEAAKLPDASLETVWVAPLAETEPNSHRFLDQAKDLYQAEEYDLAVVAAQIHFETQLRVLLQRAADRRSDSWSARIVQDQRAAALGSKVSLIAVELLLGVDPTELSDWSAFKAHKSRRNRVAHEGGAVSQKDAAASIQVVQRLWATLARAERS
jgi:hypothetical protein